METKRLKTNRGVIKYILFTIITLGIYPLILHYGMARDLNQICEGDGKRTAGLLKYIIFTILTLGIYSFIWSYAYAERMANNASRYNVTIREHGSTILLWQLVGLLLFGIGPLVAMHMQLSNLNKLAEAYNACQTSSST